MLDGAWLICRTATPFWRDGAIDEDAFRQHLQHFVDSRLGVYLASGGSGESHAMSGAELRQVYRAGVAALKGKVPVYPNPPEQHTVAATLEQTLLAAECGAEVVNTYGPEGRHGYKPTDKRSTADEMTGIISEPTSVFTTAPQKCERTAAFKADVKMIGAAPGSWTELFFPETAAMDGD